VHCFDIEVHPRLQGSNPVCGFEFKFSLVAVAFNAQNYAKCQDGESNPERRQSSQEQISPVFFGEEGICGSGQIS
tara:strand:- start:157 stop:381 length:225 start_codon:yes stop_codon:yes gene_type:complete